MPTDTMPTDSSDGIASTNEAESLIASSVTEKIEDAKRLTEAYKEEYKARERDGEILAEVDYHYYADNDATGATARIRSSRTNEGNFQTTVERSAEETTKFLSRKGQPLNRTGDRGPESSGEQKLVALFQKLRQQISKPVAVTPSQGETPKWLLDAIALDLRDETIPAMDAAFDKVDSLLSADRFDEVNQIIDHVPLEGPSLSFLMGILTITLPAADRLPNRAKFFERLYRLCKAMGRDPEDLLGGLRRWSGADGSGLLGR